MKRSLLLLLALSAGCVHAGGESAGPGGAPTAGIGTPSTEGPADRVGSGTLPSGPARALTGAQDVAGGDGPRGEPTGARQDVPTSPQATDETDARERLVRSARSHLGRRFAGDCSAFVRRVFAEAGVLLPELRAARTMTESLYRSMVPVAKPKPGDLAYFRRTRRENRGGKKPWGLSHVAIVEAVDGSRVTMIHRTSRGIRRLEMNLEHPHDRQENGILRRRRAADRRPLPQLSGELFAGYASALAHGQRMPVADGEPVISRPHRRVLGRRPPRS